MSDAMFRWVLIGYGATVAFGVLSIGLYLREISDHLMQLREQLRMRL